MSSTLENKKIAARYARALFEGATQSGELDLVLSDLSAIQDCFTSVPELPRFLESPAISLHEKMDLVKERLMPDLSHWTGNLLLMMIENKRIAAFPQVIDALCDLLRKRDNIALAEVITASELSDAHSEQLAQSLAARFGFTSVELSRRVDPGILGGVVVKIQDQIIDGSFSGKLEQLRKQLA